jgi:hypothetical protein
VPVFPAGWRQVALKLAAIRCRRSGFVDRWLRARVSTVAGGENSAGNSRMLRTVAGQVERASLTEAAQPRADGILTYPAAQPGLPGL